MLNITNLKVGESATVFKLDVENKIKMRLLELGFTSGSCVKVLAISSLKKTVLLSVKGSAIAIRTSILQGVLICKN